MTNKKLVKEKDVSVTIRSSIDGELVTTKASGEYAKRDGIRHVTYTDYTGNVITRNGLEIADDRLFLHRSGGISGNMLFDPGKDTTVSYSVSVISTEFRLETEAYRLTENEAGLDIYLKYRLHSIPETPEHVISGEQEMTIRFN